MGTSSKGIMLSGVYLMLGIFTLNFNTTESQNNKNSLSEVYFAQAEQLARIGISIATTKPEFQNNITTCASYSGMKIMNDGNVIYYSFQRPQAPNADNNAIIVSHVTINGKKVTITARYQYHNNNGTAGSRFRIVGMQTKYENL